ncbi:MAG TPA: NifU family protein [Chlamydiales bacterium]|nr:NifU family protein [Chlamydiales bacterium]
MSLKKLIRPPYWELYSKKLKTKITSFRFVGSFTPEEAKEKNMRYVKGSAGDFISVSLFWLVDVTDGVIADSKFQAFGPSCLIGAAEALSEIVLRKNYDQASRVTTDLIDQTLQNTKHDPAFPEECYSYLNLLLSALDQAVYQCRDLPFTANYENTPIQLDLSSKEILANWDTLLPEEKIKIIEQVIDKEIRPYIELDMGGVKVISLNEWEVVIAYQGACTTCHSSTGSTLSAIQEILRSRIHPKLFVTPEI